MKPHAICFSLLTASDTPWHWYCCKGIISFFNVWVVFHCIYIQESSLSIHLPIHSWFYVLATVHSGPAYTHNLQSSRHVQCLLKSWGHNQVLHECMERQYDRLGLLTNIHMLNRICCKNCCHYSRLNKSKWWRQEYITSLLWFPGTTGISHENMKIMVEHFVSCLDHIWNLSSQKSILFFLCLPHYGMEISVFQFRDSLS